MVYSAHFDPLTLERYARYLQEVTLIEHLADLLAHHPESYEHSVRVGLMVLDLGQELGLAENELTLAVRAGVLHDLGKCDVANDLLSKPATLEAHEREEMERHTRYGFDRLTDAAFGEVRKIVVAHHEVKERPYPRRGVERREDARETPPRRQFDPVIRRLTELVAVADMFDALASVRGYKPALEPAEIRRIMTTQFIGNQDLVRQCLERFCPETQ